MTTDTRTPIVKTGGANVAMTVDADDQDREAIGTALRSWDRILEVTPFAEAGFCIRFKVVTFADEGDDGDALAETMDLLEAHLTTNAGHDIYATSVIDDHWLEVAR